MKKKTLMIEVIIIFVIAIVLYVIGLSYEKLEVGAYVLLPDGSETSEVSYESKVLNVSTVVDTYGVRFSDVLYYEDLEQVTLVFISSKSDTAEDFTIKIFDGTTKSEVKVIRTGSKTQLYHSFENIYCDVGSGFQGLLLVEVYNGRNQVLERLNVSLN